MSFHDLYRMSSHAVITNTENQVLLLKATYADAAWGLPGGGLDVGETIHQALIRECKEELGCDIEILYLSGAYFHPTVHSHAFIFRCQFKQNQQIQLSHEHSAYQWFDVTELSPVQQIRVQDCLTFHGEVRSQSF